MEWNWKWNFVSGIGMDLEIFKWNWNGMEFEIYRFAPAYPPAVTFWLFFFDSNRSIGTDWPPVKEADSIGFCVLGIFLFQMLKRFMIWKLKYEICK